MKKPLKTYFTRNTSEDFLCPTCLIGHLSIENNSLQIKSTAEFNKLSPEHQNYVEAYNILELPFTVFLSCSNKNCNENVAVIGKTKDENFYNPPHPDPDIDTSVVIETFRPIAFYPPVPLIELPKRLPDNIKDELYRSFKLFWGDLAACSNALRTTVEVLLDNFNIDRTKTKDHKIVELSLHQRIEKFTKTINSEIGDFLMSIKWVGNSGSHSSQLNFEYLSNAFEMIEYALIELYDKRTERLKKISKEINIQKKL